MKKLSAFLVAVVLVLTGIPLVPSTVRAVEGDVEYIYYENGEKKIGNKNSTEYTVVEGQTSWVNSDNETWYVVKEDKEIGERITVSGEVNLILCDDATLTASAGITVASGNTLNIYGQSGSTGKLLAGTDGSTTTCEGGNAGIGGGDQGSGGTIAIHGCVVTANGGASGAGIGGGSGGNGGNVTIHDGTVTATGNDGGAGIGGGSGGNGGDGGYVTIHDGTVTAIAQDGGAGIGGGFGVLGNGGYVTVNGGTVTAIGGQKDGIEGMGIGASDVNDELNMGTLNLGAGVELYEGDSADPAFKLGTGPMEYTGFRPRYMMAIKAVSDLPPMSIDKTIKVGDKVTFKVKKKPASMEGFVQGEVVSVKTKGKKVIVKGVRAGTVTIMAYNKKGKEVGSWIVKVE